MSKILSGQKLVTSAGSAVVLGTGIVNESILVKADPANLGKIFIGNNGSDTVTSGNGFILSASESVVFFMVGDLSKIYVNADTNNSKVCWTVLNV
jgi:hypothetical protein